MVIIEGTKSKKGIMRVLGVRKIRRKWGRETRKCIWYFAILLVAVFFIIPVYWMVLMSFRPLSEIYASPINWLPTQLYAFENYTRSLSERPFLSYLSNTVMVAVIASLGNVFSSTLAAYGFARTRFPGRRTLFVCLVSTMMLPGQVKIIPLFMIYRNLGWIDTLRPLIVPAFFAAVTPLYVFLVRQFFLSIPEDLASAARIDGCNSFQVFWKIFLPLTKPAIVTVSLFSFMDNWNDFFSPLIYINSPKRMTLALGLASISGINFTEWQIIMASSVMAVLPCVVVFLSAQRYFVEGIAAIGIKG